MPDDPRSYADACGVARALDAVGERWALLVVRELSLGPLRFGQLRDGLPGISPNVLSQRLRELEGADVVDRYELDPPANTVVYELTTQGYALDPVLKALGRWGGSRPLVADREVGTVSFLRSLRIMLAPGAPDAIYGLDIVGEHFVFRIEDGAAQVARGRALDAVATLGGDVPTLRAVLLGGSSIREFETAGQLTITGDRRAARRLPRLMNRL